MSIHKKRPVYSLLFFVCVGFAVAIGLWYYVGQFINSYAGVGDVAVTSQPQVLSAKNGEASSKIDIESGSSLSALHLVFKPNDGVSLDFGPAEVDGKPASSIQLLTSSASDVSYGILADKNQSPKKIAIPFKVVCLSSGVHELQLDTLGSNFYGTDATKKLTIKDRISLKVQCPVRLHTLSNESVSSDMTLSFDPANQSVKTGEDIKVTLMMTPKAIEAGIGAVDVNLQFDGKQFESVQLGKLYDPTKTGDAAVLEDESGKLVTVEKKESDLQQGTARLFYTIHESDGDIPKKVAIPLVFKTKTKGSGSIIVGSAKASGTVSGELYNITSSTASYDTLDTNGKEVLGNISMKLQFHGITAKPEKPRPMNVKVTLADGPDDMPPMAKVITFTPDDSGFFNATFPFAFTPGDKYKFLVKGPQHLQNKVCEAKPVEGTSENEKGGYICDKGAITLKEGENIMDFSGIIMLAGDLPPQDGIINSGDLITCQNLFNKSDVASLSVCDIDQNGLVNALDYRHIIKSLDKKKDAI